MQLIIDERADAAQRDALLKIMTGQETDEMATIWWVLAAMCPNKLEPLFRPIELQVDVETRRGRVCVPGILDIRQRVAERERRFLEEAPTSTAEAATIILNGVKADQWRSLVGPDAHKIDELVRQSPERAYDVDFFDQFAREVGWCLPA